MQSLSRGTVSCLRSSRCIRQIGCCPGRLRRRQEGARIRASARPPAADHECGRRQASPPPPQPLLPGARTLLLAAAALAACADPALAADTFAPQMRPEIAVAASFAALPPILFWARIFMSAQRRQKAIDDEKAAEQERQRQREELKRKITGQANTNVNK